MRRERYTSLCTLADCKPLLTVAYETDDVTGVTVADRVSDKIRDGFGRDRLVLLTFSETSSSPITMLAGDHDFVRAVVRSQRSEAPVGMAPGDGGRRYSVPSGR